MLQRLIRQPFIFEKQRYTFTIDTDGLFLFLNCYVGSSEKNEKVPLPKFSPIEKRIMGIIWDSFGSALGSDLRSETKKMSAYVRRYFNVSFPVTEFMSALDNRLIEDGYTEFEDEVILDYLEYKQTPNVVIEHERRKYVFVSKNELDEFHERIMNEIRIKTEEIKLLRELEMDIYYKSKRMSENKIR